MLRSPYLSNRSKDFSENVGNEREDYFKNSSRARFSKKNFPGAPGVKTGDFHAKLYIPLSYWTPDFVEGVL